MQSRDLASPLRASAVVSLSLALAFAGCDAKKDTLGSGPSNLPPAPGGTDVQPGPAGSNACVQGGGVCSSGGRCNDGAAKGRYPVGLHPDLDRACGSGSIGATCCVSCVVPADAPTECCQGSYSTIPLCIDGKLGCPPGATMPPAGGHCLSSADAGPTASADAAAPPQASRAGESVQPSVKVLPVNLHPKDVDEEPAESGGWPPFEGSNFPAVSTDGKKLAFIEYADYWGHTQTPGVRIVDVGTGRTIQFLPLVPSGAHPGGTIPEALKAVPACEAKAAAANAALARVQWESLARSKADDGRGSGEWTLDGLHVTAEADDKDGWPKKLTIADAASGKVLLSKDVSGWNRSNIRCATPSLEMEGVNRARGVVVFSQQLGGTLHDCDGIVVPTDYRAVTLPPP